MPPGPKAAREAEKVRIRLVAQVDDRRNPKTAATVDQLLTRHLSMLKVGPNTMTGYEGYVRLHIRPLLGRVKVGALGAEMLDSFYAELGRCQDHCDRRSRLDHRTRNKHVCDEHKDSPCVSTTRRRKWSLARNRTSRCDAARYVGPHQGLPWSPSRSG